MRIEVQLKDQILKEVDKVCEKGKRSEYINMVLEERLNLEKKEVNETYQVAKQMERLKPEAVLKKLVDLELLNQYLFEELKKQNELMKLIHRRSTLGSRLSSLIFDNIKDKPTRIHEENLATIKIDEEIVKLKI